MAVFDRHVPCTSDSGRLYVPRNLAEVARFRRFDLTEHQIG